MLKVRLLGRCALESESTIQHDLSCAKARELLGYLACHRNRDLPREVVIGTLWGDMQEEQGKRALRQTLWQLQSALGPFQITASRPLIEADGEWLRLNPDSGIWLDVERFEQLEKETRLSTERQTNQNSQQNLKEAIDLYRGHLMEDCFKDWCIRQRDTFRHQYMRMLGRLMNLQRDSGDYDGAMTSALQILREEPASETAHLMVMWLYDREGDRTSALRQFQLCRKILRDEFNVAPRKELVDLRQQISREKKDDSDFVEDDPAANSLEKRMISLLEDIQREIVQNRQDLQKLKDSIYQEK